MHSLQSSFLCENGLLLHLSKIGIAVVCGFVGLSRLWVFINVIVVVIIIAASISFVVIFKKNK